MSVGFLYDAQLVYMRSFIAQYIPIWLKLCSFITFYIRLPSLKFQRFDSYVFLTNPYQNRNLKG